MTGFSNLKTYVVKVGKGMEMMATTTSSSISVNPRRLMAPCTAPFPFIHVISILGRTLIARS